MKQPISACIIVKSDPHLRKTIESIAPHVSEIVVTYTGINDDERAGVVAIATTVRLGFPDTRFIISTMYPKGGAAEAYFGDLIEYAPCDENGINNFSIARNHSFSSATQPWILWIDSDDEFTGELPDLSQITEANACVTCPYEYAYDDQGNCNQYQYRERIVRNNDHWEWRKRVHEGLFVKEGTITEVKWDKAVWKHRRVGNEDSKERNYRLLKLDYADMPNDPRVCHDYGLAALQNEDNEAGIEALMKCTSLSNWPEERSAAACRISQWIINHWNSKSDGFEAKDPLRWAKYAITCAPHLPEPYAYACELAAYCSMDPERNYPEAIGDIIRFGEMALKLKDVKARFFSNPMQVAFNVPMSLHIAMMHTNQGEKALEYIEQCIAVNPSNEMVQKLKFAILAQMPGFIPAKPTQEWDVVFACTGSPEAWGPENLDKGGIGGSETAVIHMARQLSSLGLSVAVYANVSREMIDLHEKSRHEGDFVAYRRIERIGEVKNTKLLVAWRHAGMLETCPADERWLWCHDTMPQGLTKWRVHLADKILALTNWHKDYMVSKGLPSDKIHVTRNGIDPSRFERGDIVRNPLKAVYTSSPDRGLEDLLDMWPEIESNVFDNIGEHPELHIYYGAKYVQSEFAKRVIKKIKSVGAIDHGRLGQRDLAKELMTAGVWLYPTNFDETSCISAMEALAAGLHVVTYARAALIDTLRGWPMSDNGDRNDFIENSVNCISYKQYPFEPTDDFKSSMSWSSVSSEWATMIDAIHPKQKFYVDTGGKPVLHMYLAESASGSIVFDPQEPNTIKVGGGCRDGFIGLAKAVAALGKYHVRAVSTWSIDHAYSDGVEWVSLQDIQRFGTPAIALAYFDTSPLVGLQGCLRIASHHTYEPHNHFPWSDVNMAPSQHSVEHLKQRFAPTSPWYVLPNGVKDEGIEWNPVPYRVIYHAPADRGLHLLLREAWPEIKRSIPEATLHVIGNVDKMLATEMPTNNPIGIEYNRRREEIRLGIAECEAIGGVTFLGLVDRETLRKEIGEAACFAFPASLIGPSETFSVSLMECCKAGVPVVTSDADSLREIYGEHAMVISDIDRNMATFTETVIALLRGHAFSQAMSLEGKKLAAKYTFDKQAQVLDKIIQENIH